MNKRLTNSIIDFDNWKKEKGEIASGPHCPTQYKRTTHKHVCLADTQPNASISGIYLSDVQKDLSSLNVRLHYM